MGTLDKPTLTGIIACALPVAAFSAWSQFETARLSGVPWGLAWVFPMATDATAFVATRVWLDSRFAPDAKDGDDLATRKRKVRRYAAGLALACILLSVGGAAAHLAVQGIAVPWQLQLAIGGLPSVALAGLVHLAAIIAAASIPARSKPRKDKAAKTAGTVGHRPPTSTVPAPKPPTATPEVGKGSKRTLMLAWLDEHPDAADNKTIGAELDQLFGTSNYGRGVVRAWKKARELPKASGE